MTPRFEERGDIAFVGLRQDSEPRAGVDGPGVWRRFRTQIETIPRRRGTHTLGVIEVLDKAAGAIAYTAAVEVERIGKLPRGLYGKRLPGGRFAVFTHKLASRDIGGELRRSFGFIYGTWVPNSGAKLRAPYDLELYDGRFDNKTISGEVEIWVPVA